MRPSTFIFGFLVAAGLASGQSITLKDGRVLGVTRVTRQGDRIVVEAAPSGEISLAVSEVARIDVPEPSAISQVPDLIVAGKGDQAISLIEPVVNQQVDFREIPGNWWALAALRLAQALESQGRGLESQALAEKISSAAADREMKGAAEVQIAFVQLRRGDRAAASRLAEGVLKECRGPVARAGAFVVKGQCLLGEEKWEEAILSLLQVPVFYPGETALLPSVLLGRARAHLGMEDFPAARATLEELRTAYPGSAEAKLVPAELERVAASEQGVAGSR